MLLKMKTKIVNFADLNLGFRRMKSGCLMKKNLDPDGESLEKIEDVLSKPPNCWRGGGWGATPPSLQNVRPLVGGRGFERNLPQIDDLSTIWPITSRNLLSVWPRACIFAN